jgi:hypothetical protein
MSTMVTSQLIDLGDQASSLRPLSHRALVGSEGVSSQDTTPVLCHRHHPSALALRLALPPPRVARLVSHVPPGSGAGLAQASMSPLCRRALGEM